MNFALVMFILLAVMGGIWLVDKLFFLKRRAKEAKEPWWVAYSKSFFPVILAVFLLRSFLVEPFKIPSGSMIPTLLVGDFILVNKYTYGIRLPILNIKIADISQPQRGDVMVFRFPMDTSTDFIKRVIAIPGDKISYKNKQISINGHAIEMTSKGDYDYVESGLNYIKAERYEERLGDSLHSILVDPNRPVISLMGVKQFPFIGNCAYNVEGFTCTVPEKHYFMLGDNRDSSHDSRYWGFVPEQNIVGKAMLIWWNFDQMKRVGTTVN
jgi:signal peptidase I